MIKTNTYTVLYIWYKFINMKLKPKIVEKVKRYEHYLVTHLVYKLHII